MFKFKAMNSFVILSFHHFFREKKHLCHPLTSTPIIHEDPIAIYECQCETPTPWEENEFSCQICHRIHVFWYIYLHLKPN